MSRLTVWFLIVALTAWFFAGALFADDLFGYRDAAHYYYPLFQFVQQQWSNGSLPLWNPQENLGAPLLANPTASVLYPGKLVFLLPLDYAWQFRLYVIGHVLLAAGAAYTLARRWDASRLAAGVAAISFAFSGNVLFQYSNVIYLVGAAWLPVACLAADRMLCGRSLRGAIALGVVLAMMILGGDPQAAYHAGLLALLYALLLRRSAAPTDAIAHTRFLSSRPALLLLAAATGLVLAAVQIIPSIEFARHTGRTTSTTARNLYEIPARLVRGEPNREPWFDGLLCRNLDPKMHQQHVYHFSVGPWRLLEYLWPNVGGRPFPVHRRWLDIVPAEGRFWVPSLYMGLLPLVLAISAWRIGRGDARTRWMSWTALVAVVASTGWFGLGWLARETLAAWGADPAQAWVGAPVGGLYWLMTVLLPGYIYFRYPAKLMVVAALAVSLLAAQGWDRFLLTRSHSLRRGLLALAGVSAAGAVAALLIRPFWSAWMAGVGPDPVFGPLDIAGAYSDLITGFLQTTVFGTLFFLLLRLPDRVRWMPTATLALAAADLAIANAWLVACVPAELFRHPPIVATIFTSPGPLAPEVARAHISPRPPAESEGGQQASPRPLAGEGPGVRAVGNGGGSDTSSRPHPARCSPPSPASGPADGLSDLPNFQPYRIAREELWVPPSWQQRSSPERMAELVRWSRDSLWPNYQQLTGLALANVPTTMITQDYQAVLSAAKDSDAYGGRGLPVFGKYAIRHSPPLAAGSERIELPAADAAKLEDVSLWYLPDHLPRAWIVHEVEAVPPLERNDPDAVRGRTREVFLPQGPQEEKGSGFRVRGSGFENSPRPLAGEGQGVRAVESWVVASSDRPHPARCSPPSPASGRGEGQPRDLRHTAVIETTSPVESFKSTPLDSANSETCQIVRYEPLQVEIQAELKRPGLVILCDQFYPGWTLDVTTPGKPPYRAPILRTNHVMRGVWLQAGRHHLVYRYRPTNFLLGAMISILAWLGLVIAAVVWLLRSARRASAC